MKRFIVLMLVVAGVVASPVRAEKGGARGPVVLPAEVVAALDAVAAASEARVKGGDPGAVDAQLADALRGLARSVDVLAPEDDAAFAMFVQEQTALLGRELASRMAAGRPPQGGELADALDALRSAIADHAQRRPDSGADGPTNRCFLEFALCLAYCAALPTAMQRAMCGLDCEIDLAACFVRAGLVKPFEIKVPGAPAQPQLDPSVP